VNRNAAEQRVYALCSERGLQPTYSNGHEDSTLHIDMYVNIYGRRTGIDVKGPRRVWRHDPNYSTSFTWLELRNRHGLRGSLYGDARYLVVASPNGWLWVVRNQVAAECTLRCIENLNRVEKGLAWWTKERGNSLIILVPYTYLYSVAAYTWPDEYLNTLYNAQYKQESNARPLGT